MQTYLHASYAVLHSAHMENVNEKDMTVSELVAIIYRTIPTKGEMNKRFVEVNEHLDRIENLILADHKRRIEALETELKKIKNALAV